MTTTASRVLTTTNPHRWNDDFGNRFYISDTQPDMPPFASVTTQLNVVASDGLMFYPAAEAAKFTVANMPKLYRLWEAGDHKAVASQVRNAPWDKRDKAAGTGSQAHDLVRASILGEPLPAANEDAAKRFHQFERFRDEMQPEFKATEVAVYNATYGYAGQIDLVADLPEYGITVIDVKAGNGIYDKHGWQVNAYGNAEWMEPDGPRNVRFPRPDTLAILHLQVTQWKLQIISGHDHHYSIFLAAVDMFRRTKITVAPEPLFLSEIKSGREKKSA